MSLSPSEAESMLSDAELAPCMSGGLRDIKELVRACLDAEIPALIGADPHCEKGCAPKVQLLVRTDDVDRVRDLVREQWMAMVEELGVDPSAVARGAGGGDSEGAAEGDPPCPACGTAAPLVNGACTDCGLQLE